MSRARTFADLANASEAGSLASPNMIINGDMAIAQRGTSSTGESTSGIKVVDQFHYVHGGGGTSDISQSSTAPSEFKNSLKVECNSADASLGASEFVGIRQHIEAQNCQSLLYGTSSAKTTTLSFWVRSKQTGTYAVNLYLDDDSRQFTKTYAISSADTWEKKTITFIGDTTGVIEDDIGKGLEITWWLRIGSTYTSGDAMSGWEAFANGDYAVGHAVDFLDNTANEFYLTGVQLEIGEVATPFKYESHGDNLIRCQRYFYAPVTKAGGDHYFSNGWQYDASNLLGLIFHPVQMRTSPTLISADGTNYFSFYRAGAADHFNDVVLNTGNDKATSIINANDMSGTAGHAGGMLASVNAFVYLTAELE
mgnify:CR=1 FL=1|tara:strand:+ start:1331 stop:2428 length:1098 start_codon:yes stop_codon:yes gene_type:complete